MPFESRSSDCHCADSDRLPGRRQRRHQGDRHQHEAQHDRPGPARREQMINLSAMSAGEIGWNYTETLAAIAGNAAPIQEITGSAMARAGGSLCRVTEF